MTRKNANANSPRYLQVSINPYGGVRISERACCLHVLFADLARIVLLNSIPSCSCSCYSQRDQPCKVGSYMGMAPSFPLENLADLADGCV